MDAGTAVGRGDSREGSEAGSWWLDMALGARRAPALAFSVAACEIGTVLVRGTAARGGPGGWLRD